MISAPNIFRLAYGLALAVTVMAIGVLIGWSFHVSVLKSLLPGLVPMSPTTAVVFILAGASLALSLLSSSGNKPQGHALILASRLCALVVALVGLIKFGGYQAGIDLDFDRWLFGSQLSVGGSPLPIRIAPNTALNFLLLGSALLAVNVKSRLGRTCVNLMIGVVLCAALVAALGYIYQVHGFYSIGGLAPMSIYTTTLFLLLGLAFLLSHSDTGLLSVIAGSSAGGTIARRLIPAAILVPACLGWLELQGQIAGLYDNNMGNAIFALAYILIFTLLICWSALALFNADLEREQSKTKLSFNEQRYRVLVESTTAMVWDTPASGQFEVEQPGWTAFTGQSFEELKGWGWLNAVHPDDQTETKRVWSEAFAGRSTYKVEHRLMARDRTYRNMMVRAIPVLAADGTVSQWFGVHTDITESKQTEEALRLLNSAVLQSKEAILITDAELDLPGPKIIFANPAFASMTGYTVSEAIGKTPRILQGPLTDKSVLGRFRQNLARGEIFEGEAINYRKDGTKFNLEWQVAPVRNASEKVTHFVAIQRDITDRKRIEARARLLVDSNVQGVLFWNRNGEITEANDAFLRLVHYTRADLEAGLINWMALTPPEYAHLDQRSLAEIAATGVGTPYEKEYILKDGSHVPILLGAASFPDDPEQGVCFVLDLTDRKRLEAKLFQSHKLETVGKMAGGIAHEFNSILTAILGQSELLIADLPAGDPLVNNATEINKAAGRAAILTRQLLAYGRKQILQPECLDLNAVLTGLENTLRQMAGPGSDVRLVAEAELRMVKADAGQIELVILNLVMNAADAMPHGGKLTLETANITLDQEYVSNVPDLKAGEYVMLAITDTGIGMSRELKARVFEPFFSTKSVGQGTGLGLSTSYGIIKQSGGHINAYSELGQGTTFKIYLPQIEAQAKNSDKPADSLGLPRGTETILLVEDDPALREMAAKLLLRLGYTVLKAANGPEALGLNEQRDHAPIDLLFTDVVMPHMSGKELSERILVTHPQVKILFASAYTENAIVHQGILNEGVALLQKPFTPSALAKKLRDVLDK